MGDAGTQLDGQRSRGVPASSVAETLALGEPLLSLRVNKQQRMEGRKGGNLESSA